MNRVLGSVFPKKLGLHKKLISSMVRDENLDLIVPVSMLGKELALVYSGFRCEACKSLERLQYHHLIMRSVKKLTDYWRYLSQRHYWANILVLCNNCHVRTHRRDIRTCVKLALDGGFISADHIESVKEKYFPELKKGVGV